ncbi:hybrid sensor histidine kinase/response regulator [Phormidium sp. CCY1219]|uniref:hybrid sensor histidine kinase/response regulator n=1 Tax=Phormidium sp. CCY1219 TaxID=2886104 RepID=UPI002D1F0D20|nr:ATP-binding protein [Phormidium sp. CCY1219]MEB3827723.1 response regulator [Phormidium sp. CCY1219]
MTHILLVEDHLGDAELLQEILSLVSADRFHIDWVQRVSQALECLGEVGFDVVLLDLSLPDSQGLETLMRVQAAAPTVPIVVLTGSNDQQLAIAAVRNGAQDYLVKGQLDGAGISRAIYYAIERKQTLEQLRQSEERFQALAADRDAQVQERTRQLQQALEFEATLKRIMEKVRDSLDESQILQTAVEELAIGLNVDYCDAALYDSALRLARVCYEYSKNYPSFLGRVVQIADTPEIYSQLLRAQTVQFCPLVIGSAPDRAAILATPIFDESGAIGDLCLFKPAGDTFSEPESRLVQQVANQCAIAVRQARLYQAAQAQVRELERLNRLKDDFLSTVSHELRTPVANIKMAAQMLEIIHTQHKSASETAKAPASLLQRGDRYIKILQTECDREMKLIETILNLQRLDAGVESIELSAINLQQWIPSLIAPFEPLVQKQQQRLRLDIPSTLPPVLCDSGMLGRILSESIENACKYTPPGEEIAIAVQRDRQHLRFQVSNTGVEIPPEELPHIFDKFYRVPSTDPWKHGGTGLGLALVRKLTEHLGGTIQATSGDSKTSFIVELPWRSATDTANSPLFNPE